MAPRRSPAAQELHATVVAHPAGLTMFRFKGAERLVFTTADVAELIWGTPADAAEAKRFRDRIVDYHHRGELRGRRVGNYLLFAGDAVADFVRSLDPDVANRKTA